MGAVGTDLHAIGPVADRDDGDHGVVRGTRRIRVDDARRVVERARRIDPMSVRADRGSGHANCPVITPPSVQHPGGVTAGDAASSKVSYKGESHPSTVPAAGV